MKGLLASLILLLPLTACGSQQESTLKVFAAASLQESFTELAKGFEKDHDVRVELNFGPSSGLAEQINNGADADVFASASTSTMARISENVRPRVFAVNSMEIAVPKANPADIESVTDLANPDVKVALCQAEVPCGVVAAEVLKNAGIELTPVTEETDVKAVLTKVQLGEVDAGIVYVTDVEAAGRKVMGIGIPESDNASTDYPIAVIDDTPMAKAWLDLVMSPTGRKVLQAHGFGVPH